LFTKLVLLWLTVILLGITQNVFAEVWIPENEFTSYYDDNGIFTVVGAVKNSETSSIIPTITITIQDDYKTITQTFELAKIYSSIDLPFKLKFPEIYSKNAILQKPELVFEPVEENESLPVEVIYDNSLITHEDGHKSGKIINKAGFPVSNIRVLALIQGKNGTLLDVGRSVELIDKMKSGEVREFSIYPDPTIASQVKYYSCFVPSDTSIVPITAIRNGEKFYFRYDSGTWYYDAKFNEDGTELSMKTQTSFNIDTYASFEFPSESDNQKFQVYLNNEPKEFIQSRDDLGNFHVSFIVEPLETGELVITGFKKGWAPDENSRFPNWLKNNAKSWSEDKITKEEFVSAIKYMINFEMIDIPISDFKSAWEVTVPDWVKHIAGWWGDEKISDLEFSKSIQFLLENKIIDL
jgi:hypothetical protein